MSFNFSEIFKDQPKEKIYEQLYQMAEGLFYDERDMLANMGNLSSLLYFNLSNINWAGFYLYKNDELVLGPFNGKVACTRIAMGRGVCGTAAAVARRNRAGRGGCALAARRVSDQSHCGK